MNNRIVVIMALVVFIIAASVMLLHSAPSQIILIPFGLIGISLVFFSRGILIFLTAICLMVTQSHIAIVRSVTAYLRWVFFMLFALHVFGDIFLGRTVRRIKSFDILAITFIIYAFLSASYSPYPSLTLERASTILLLYICVFWIIWKYTYNQGPEKVTYLLLQVMMLILIASYLMIFIGPYRPFLAGRFTGIFGNPNSMGLICAILLPLALWEYLVTKKKAALFLFFVMLISLFFSGSRGSLNATAISLGYFIYARSKKYKPLVFFFSLSLILIFIWVIQTLGKQFFTVYFRAETIPTIGGRLEVWPIALALIIDKPIFGYGFGVEEKIFTMKYGLFYSRPDPIGYFHNSYLGMTLQLGILGLAIFFIPLFIFLFKELFSKQDSSEMPSLRYALRASTMAGLVCGIYESWIYSVGNPQAFPFWVIVMLLTFYRYQDKGKITQDKEKIMPEGT